MDPEIARYLKSYWRWCNGGRDPAVWWAEQAPEDKEKRILIDHARRKTVKARYRIAHEGN